MTRDARVESAISHWAPRFVSNGVPLVDFQEVTAGLQRWDDWCSAWGARGAIHEKLGAVALQQGYRLSAGQHLTTAALCYHFGKFLLVENTEEKRRAHAKAIECRRLALPHLRPPGERVAIPYRGTTLAGILRKPAGPAPYPVLIMAMGLDSAKEEMDSYESTFLARGMATLSFDGPGQGEAEYALPIRGDYEGPVTAVVDWLATREDLDASRVGIWGVSLGGYYAPRAAAFEPRLKACISLAGPFDLFDVWEGLPELTREAFRARAHLATPEEAREFARGLTLKEVGRQITCPIFIVAGKLDRIIPYQAAEQMAEGVSGPVELLVIEDGNHVANNRAYAYRPRTADWMAEQLGAGKS